MPERAPRSADSGRALAALLGQFRRNYDVAEDGQFLMIRAASGVPGELNVIFNWFTEIEQRFGGR
jgi:hypothetical protein